MLKTLPKFILATATASMMVMPAIGHAKTRAGDRSAVYSAPAAQPGEARDADGEKFASPADLFAWFLVALWASGVVVAVADDEPDQSPGT
ncbi:MAG: hypothetical protein SXU28_01500 [Pseudomonadota bacterium]|nr:hypothetical protein [Pseudomonadota bacterium]